ncbi:hypothetical protein ACQKCU_03690 [Heyndrickxia sporothermodurans]
MKCFKAIFISLFFLFVLTACREKNTFTETNKSKVHSNQSKTVNVSSTQNTAEEATSSDLYGFWGNKESFIIISNASEGKYSFVQYKKNKDEERIGDFVNVIPPQKNHFNAQFVNGKQSGKEFSIELNKKKDQLTIMMNNKSTVYKATDLTPKEYFNKK